MSLRTLPSLLGLGSVSPCHSANGFMSDTLSQDAGTLLTRGLWTRSFSSEISATGSPREPFPSHGDQEGQLPRGPSRQTRTSFPFLPTFTAVQRGCMRCCVPRVLRVVKLGDCAQSSERIDPRDCLLGASKCFHIILMASDIFLYG